MLPKINPEERPEWAPPARIFANCPDCGVYLIPGFRTDCCTHCWANFAGTEEFRVASDEMRHGSQDQPD